MVKDSSEGSEASLLIALQTGYQVLQGEASHDRSGTSRQLVAQEALRLGIGTLPTESGCAAGALA